AHAHEDSTNPVLRGDFVLRKLLCEQMPHPAEVGIETVFPPPSPASTTRERFTSHVTNPACQIYHDRIDKLNFTFERFDAINGVRANDNNKPIDEAARVEIGKKTVSFADSFELSEWLGRSPRVADCYARQAFRYFTAQAD